VESLNGNSSDRHLPQLEQAQRFNAAVLEFLESVE
jgi:pimeloyl-ACP methyl ester carboxylesterase